MAGWDGGRGGAGESTRENAKLRAPVKMDTPPSHPGDGDREGGEVGRKDEKRIGRCSKCRNVCTMHGVFAPIKDAKGPSGATEQWWRSRWSISTALENLKTGSDRKGSRILQPLPLLRIVQAFRALLADFVHSVNTTPRSAATRDRPVKDRYSSPTEHQLTAGCRLRQVDRANEHDAVLTFFNFHPLFGPPTMKRRQTRSMRQDVEF